MPRMERWPGGRQRDQRSGPVMVDRARHDTWSPKSMYKCQAEEVSETPRLGLLSVALRRFIFPVTVGDNLAVAKLIIAQLFFCNEFP